MQTTQNEIGTQVQLAPDIAAMLERADNLFALGYFAQLVTPNILTILAPPSAPGRLDARRYEINLALNTCSCACFYGGKLRTRDGRRTCKHLAGIFTLAADCEQSNRAFYEQVACELNATADYHQRRAVHMGCSLQMAFGLSDRARSADEAKRSADAMAAMLNVYRPREGRRAADRRAA